MNHILGLFLQDAFPAEFGNVVQPASRVVLLPALSRQDRIGIWQRNQLKLGWLCSVISYTAEASGDERGRWVSRRESRIFS